MTGKTFVTGIGIISSIGNNITEFRNSLYDGISGFEFIPNDNQNKQTLIAAQIKNFSFKESLRRMSDLPDYLLMKADRCASRAPVHIQYSVICALEAWIRSLLHKKPVESEKIGIVVSGHNITNKYQHDLFDDFKINPEYINPRFALHFFDSDHIGILSEIFSIKGEGMVTGGASASGNIGIIQGARLIKSGDMDICIVIAPVFELHPLAIQSFVNIGAFGGKKYHDAPKKACRPFDCAHEGFIYGQGAGCIILESEKSVISRNVEALAQIPGYAIVLDGNQSSNPNEEGEVNVMEKALKKSQLKPEMIDLVSAHGTSSPLGDITEIRAIKRVFKNCLEKVCINSTKGLTGHCLTSAGVIEAIAGIIELNEGFIHPNINIENPIDSECRFSDFGREIKNFNCLLSNSFGFGGINTSIVIQKSDFNGWN